jgi:ATP-grasp domain
VASLAACWSAAPRHIQSRSSHRRRLISRTSRAKLGTRSRSASSPPRWTACRTRWRYTRRHQRSSCAEIAPFLDIAEPTIHEIKDAAARLGLPLMLKSKTLAYDRCGNYILRDQSHTQDTPSKIPQRPPAVRREIGAFRQGGRSPRSCVLSRGSLALSGGRDDL